MEFKKEEGKKNAYGKDEVLFVRAKEWEAISISEIIYIIDHILKNEERIYPKKFGFKGNDMFLEEIRKLI